MFPEACRYFEYNVITAEWHDGHTPFLSNFILSSSTVLHLSGCLLIWLIFSIFACTASLHITTIFSLPSPHPPPLSVSSLQDRWGEQDYSSFSPRWPPIHQGHSCVWIMSELRSKYLFMTSCLDWCSYAIWCPMHHSWDVLAAQPCRRRVALSVPLKHWEGGGKKKRAFQGRPRNAMLPQVSLWLWVVLMKCLAEEIHLIWCRFTKKKKKRNSPFRHEDQFWA